jgi:hypothetical protein
LSKSGWRRSVSVAQCPTAGGALDRMKIVQVRGYAG